MKVLIGSLAVASTLTVSNAASAQAYINDRCQLANEQSLSCVIEALTIPALSTAKGSLRIVNGVAVQKPGGHPCEIIGVRSFFAKMHVDGTLITGGGGNGLGGVGGEAVASGHQGKITTDWTNNTYVLELSQEFDQNIVLKNIPLLTIPFDVKSEQDVSLLANDNLVTGHLVCWPQDNKTIN